MNLDSMPTTHKHEWEVLARSPMPDMELVTLALDCETLHKWLLEVADEETVAALGICECGALRQQPHAADCGVRG